MTPTELQAVIAKFRHAETTWQKQRDREKDDLACQMPDGLWDAAGRRGREATIIAGVAIPARPMLGIATLDEPLALILNQEKAAQLTPHVHAASEDATDDTAKVLEGLYRQITTSSRANVARSWAYDRAVKAGLGWYRINTVFDPEGGHPFDQKIVYERILDQARVYPDPFAQEPDWSDGECLFVATDMRFTTFKRKYKHSQLSKHDDKGLEDIGLEEGNAGWIGGDDEATRMIRVAEYWRVEITTRTYVLCNDGQVYLKTQIPPDVKEVTGDEARSRDEEVRKVYWSLITCKDQLTKPVEWNGKYIPIIPVVGRELQPYDGERKWIGMIHNAKDGARLTNVAASNAVEMAAHEPKAPWQGEEGVFEGHEKEYQESAYRTLPYLQYKPTNSAGERSTPPARVQVTVSSMGPSLELLRMGQGFVQQAMFTFGPALGQQTPAHRSGKAIENLQEQTVFGTSHFLDSLATISLQYESLVMLDLIPHVYDRPGRVARILDDKDIVSSVMLNSPFVMDPNTKRPQSSPVEGDPQVASDDQRTPVKYYDLSKGRYTTTITIGKSNASRLKEGADQIGAFLEAAPEMLIPLGPEYMKFQDFPGASAISDTLKKMRDHDLPWLSPEAEQNASAKVAALEAENQQLKQVASEMQKQIETDAVKAQSQAAIAAGKDASQAQIKSMEGKIELLLQEMKNAATIHVAEINAMTKGVQIQSQVENDLLTLDAEQSHERQMASEDRAHQVGTQAMAGAQTLEQQQQKADLTPKPKPNGSGA